MPTQEKIRAIVAAVAKRPVELSDDESLFESGILDSFSLIDLVAEIEREFQVKIPDSELNPRQFNSISEIEMYLNTFR